jgi:hypothetical protein
MTIDRQHGKLILSCDSCDAAYEGNSAEWNEVWPEAKAEGWKAKKIGKDWVHACPDCEVA